jgi:HAE1 family hydrophobic/amphiphilic exporter-1
MKLLPRPPGIEFWIGGDREGGEDTDASSYSVALEGEDPELLQQVRDDLEQLLVQIDGVLGIRGAAEPPPNELGLVVDRDRAQRYGVNPQVVAGVVGAALRGMELPKYHADGKEIPVRVSFAEEDRESLTELNDFLVPSATGELLPVATLTDARYLKVPETIFRRDKKMGRVITLELKPGREEETRRRLALLQSAIDLPEGVSFGADAQGADLDNDLAAMQYALLLSVVFIYLLMGFLFESFVLPLSIIVTIPLSMIGVWWIHWFAGKSIDFLGVVAMVLLVGVVVNNGIVLIDYVNRLCGRGHARQEALATATARRFRPIMMTAITTIGGLIPLAFAGSNSIGLSYTSFALTLIGGMTTATLLTLLVVPVFYTFFDDAREAFATALRRATSGRRAAAPGAAPAESA